ncbi:uncharacterized protein LOC131737615 [Acipenser ruthenus]|uniref:uncharacterized protein LOC131737615 n=1 Tax=Acipenser ruthenus TaxID=7906 RepID=UPI002741C01B|nr:uncharacterized protein LOC131737615 [Acipenser ruthenus]
MTLTWNMQDPKINLYWDFQLLTGDRPSELSLLLASGNALKLYHNLIPYRATINQALGPELGTRWSDKGLRAVLCDNGDSIKRTKYLTTHDLLRVVDDKYEIMQQKLYTEMLEDHYGCSSWEAMLGWQQEKKLVELQALTEHAFINNDSISLSELPGAFRLYRSSNRLVLLGFPENVDSSSILEWTAVYNLKELHKNYQEEKASLKKKLAFNSKSNFDESAWTLLHFYLQATTLKAKRQRYFQTAVLASHQCWDKWPEVKSSHLEELARHWLTEVGLTSWDKSLKKNSDYSMQQTALESLMARQEWEREYLIKLLHSITPEDLRISQNTKQEQNLEPFIGLSKLPGDSLLESADVFRKGCALKLREVRTALEETAQEAMWGDCAACVLTELIQQQEQELNSTMKALVDMVDNGALNTSLSATNHSAP